MADPARRALVALTEDDEVLARAFRAAGALSPATARALHEIPGVDATAVIHLAARGTIREAAPGRYFWYPGGVHEQRQKLLTAVLIAASCAMALVGLPLAAWLLRH